MKLKRNYSVTIIIAMLVLLLSTLSVAADDSSDSGLGEIGESPATAEEVEDAEEADASESTQTEVKDRTVYNYLAIFIEFPDLPDITISDPNTLEAARMILDGDGEGRNVWGFTIDDLSEYYSADVVSLKRWLERYSYGDASLRATILPEAGGAPYSHMASHNITYYMPMSEVNPDGYTSDEERYARECELIREALDDPDFRSTVESLFSGDDLDKNNDGTIDAISFFVESDPSNTELPIVWRDLLWSHKSYAFFDDFTLCGKAFSTYNIINVGNPKLVNGVFAWDIEGKELVLNNSGYGTIIHEFLHTLGLPDLYRGTGSFEEPVNFYDIMAFAQTLGPLPILSVQASDQLQWGKSIPIIRKNGEITISKPRYKDSSEVKSYKIISPFKTDEYFIVEYYEAPNYPFGTAERNGYIVYRVDTNTYTNMGQPGGRDYIYVFRPKDSYPNEGGGWIAYAVQDLEVGKTYGKTLDEANDGWDSDTIYYNDGSNSGIKFEMVSYSDDAITLRVTMPEAEGSGTDEDPFIVHNIDEWNSFVTQRVAIKLANDLDFTGANYIPPSAVELRIDGDGRTIYGLDLADSGLFQSMAFCTVKNLNISGLKVRETTGESYLSIGGICNNASNTDFENVSIKSGTISATPTSGAIGSFTGVALSCNFTNCSSNADIIDGNPQGAFAGVLEESTLTDCVFTGRILNSTDEDSDSDAGKDKDPEDSESTGDGALDQSKQQASPAAQDASELIVATGDHQSLVLYVVILIFALAMLTAVLIRNHRRK